MISLADSKRDSPFPSIPLSFVVGSPPSTSPVAGSTIPMEPLIETFDFSTAFNYLQPFSSPFNMTYRPAAVALATALVAAAVMLPLSQAALTCSTVYQTLYPCLSYLQSGGSVAPPEPCCSGISSLMTAAGTTEDRRTACTCLKAAAAGVNLNLAGALPKKCGVYVPYKISPSTDCNKVK